MPIHEKFKRDPETNKVVKDENGEPVMLVEGIDYGKFPANFIAETKEEAVKIYGKYLRTLQLLAHRYSGLTGLAAEDLIQEGTIGLARASRDFEECRSDNFSIFAIYKIKDAMREFVTSQGSDMRAPQYVKDTLRLVNKLKRVISSAESIDFCSLLDIWQMSRKYRDNKEIGKDIEQIRESLYNLASRSCTVVEELIERAESTPLISLEIVDYGVDSVPSKSDVFSLVVESNTLELIKDVLNERELEILRLHFIEGHTIRETAEILSKRDGTIAVQIRQLREKLEIHKHKLLGSDPKHSISADDLPCKSEDPESDIINSLSIKQLREVLSEADYKLLIGHYIEGKTVRELGEEVGLKGPTISVRISRIIEKLKKDWILNDKDNKNIEETGQGDAS